MVDMQDIALDEVDEHDDDGNDAWCEDREIAFEIEPLWAQQIYIVDREERECARACEYESWVKEVVVVKRALGLQDDEYLNEGRQGR